VRRFSSALLVLVLSSPALSGAPAPSLRICGVGFPDEARIGFGISAPGATCQHRFRADGGLDVLTLSVTLRDPFDTPVDSAGVEVHLVPTAATVSFCSCEGLVSSGVTNAQGVVDVQFSALGGYGSIDLALTASAPCHPGDPPLRTGFGRWTIDFTSPDLDASCDGARSTSVFDLGIWAQGLTTYRKPSDYNCDGLVNVFDLGTWAFGLLVGCDDSP